MTVLLRRFHASALVAFVVSTLVFLSGTRLFAQTGASAPDRIVSPVRTDLPGRTVWAFATTGTGTNITTFAATDKGLYKSSGGAWALTSLDKQSVYAVKSRRVGNVTTLLVGTDKGVLRSTDGGNTWTSPEVTTGTVSTSNIVALKKVFDIEVVGTNWFVATEKGVYRSTNDGRSWSLVNIDRTADNNEVRGITTDGNTIIVNLWKEGLWRSTNNGNSWTKLSIAGETALVRSVFTFPTTTGSVWLAGSVAGNIWRSLNSGSSWTQVYQGASALRSSATSERGATTMGVDAIDGGTLTGYRGRKLYTLFATTPGGILYSLNGGRLWERTRTQDMQAQSIIVSGNKVFIGEDSPLPRTLAGKEIGSSLTSGGGGGYEYDATCSDGTAGGGPDQSQLSRSGCGGGSGSVGGDTPPSGYTGGSYTIISKAPRIRSLDYPSFAPTASQAMRIAGDNFALSLSPDPGTDIPDAFVMADSNAPASQQYFLPRVSYADYEYRTNITAPQSTTPGTYYIRVVTFFGETFSAPFTVVAPAPTLMGINPASGLAGTTITLTASGSNFGSSPTLLLNGVEPSGVQYTTQNSTTVTAMFPAPPAQSYNVSIRAGGVGGQTTTTIPFTVTNPTATLSVPSTNPASPMATQSVSVSVPGTGLVSGLTTVSLSGPSGNVAITPNIANGTITFTFTPSIGGTYTLTAVNQGTPSASQSFVVGTPPPTPSLTSVSFANGTDSISAGSGQQTITLTGSNFVNTSVVQLGGTALTTTYSFPTQLTAVVPSSSLANPNRSLVLTVTTPPVNSVGGGTSQSQNLDVLYPQPTLTGISSNPINARSVAASQWLTFTGSGLYSGTQVLWDYNTTNLSTLPFSGAVGHTTTADTIGLSLGAAFFSTPRVVSVVLSNPGYTGNKNYPAKTTTLTSYSYIINTIKPILTSVSPRQIVWNGTPFDQIVSASGTNFFSSSRLIVVSEGSRELSPVANQDGAGTLRITGLGTFLLKVKNPAVISGGQEFTSDFIDTVRVVNPAPSILNASPSSFALNAVPASITLQGQAFMSGMTATIAGLPATVVPSAQTSVTLQFSSQTQQALASLGAGAYNIVLTNPAPSLGTGATLVTVYNPQMSSFTISPSPFTLSVPTLRQMRTIRDRGRLRWYQDRRYYRRRPLSHLAGFPSMKPPYSKFLCGW